MNRLTRLETNEIIGVAEYRLMKKPVSKRNQPESALQQQCVEWFDWYYPNLKLNLFSIPNEGARTAANGARMKAQGRRAGVADMFLAVAENGFHGLFIEFKVGKGKQTESQKLFQEKVHKQNYYYFVVNTYEMFKYLMTDYLGNPNNR